MTSLQKYSRFRPCIDLHNGEVKQIVGGTLNEGSPDTLKTNFVSREPAEYYAKLYRENNLTGAHVVKLGPNNDSAAKAALEAWPGGLQIGGGITIENAEEWLSLGASKVIVTSWLFPEGNFSLSRLQEISSKIGKDKLVVDLSCRKAHGGWRVAIDRWQTVTELEVCQDTMDKLSEYCSEFLVHAADVEGLCQGIDLDLVKRLGAWTKIPITYAGGANSIEDLRLVHSLSQGKVDLTFGSALDIFGGSFVNFKDCVAWNLSGPESSDNTCD